MKIALGSDHRGTEASRALARHLEAQGHEVLVLGECSDDPCDYPDNAYLVASAVSRGDAERGILVCGTGIGMSIAANKVPGIRAALVHDELTAEVSRRHNDANVLCLAGDTLSSDRIPMIAERWLEAPFDGGRHERRVKKIAAIERGENPAEEVKKKGTGVVS